ncbi:MAG: CRISPR-associated helicase Cas3' [Porticoccaceae bacterium]
MIKPKKNTDVTLPQLPYHRCPAKTFYGKSGEVLPGRDVFTHCLIVGEVARELVKRQLFCGSQSLYPCGSHLVPAGHDIGKVSPTFVEKIRRACSPAQWSLPDFPGINPQLESQWGGHAGVSQLAAKALGVPDYVPEILGQHHGYSPPVAGLRADDEQFGGAAWQAERAKLVDALKQALKADWPQVAGMAHARVLAGLTSVADWIGSGEFFEDPDQPWQENIDKALDAAGFVPAAYKSNLEFCDVFGFEPRAAQASFIDQVKRPGVYVLEAPMGLGKTEAALFAAYRMLSTGQANGVYFALPTQLTSNKIFERFNSYLDQILTEGCSHRSLLLHANAWQITDMGEEGRPGGAWFNRAKRGLLAPFAVGTIDQALMAAMNVKHGFVRAFGLAGKVVILDEVHTYDAYTGTLLDALVELLRALHCTVIILSATLNQERRSQLLDCELKNTGYPLITACPSGLPVTEVALPAGGSETVEVRLLGDDRAAIESALVRAEQGQQILWIENTVAEAQQRYLDLAARAHELDVACGLLHSRFTAEDRQTIEDYWVSQFGKPGWKERERQGRILVGTQVLEQSLDIDADFMVSRFAPTDMLLQRMGRLWRHADTPRASGARRECWLLAPELDSAIQQPLSAFGSSAHVYSSYVLCRSLEVWQGLVSLQLPDDIRPLIEATYISRDETEPMSRWLHELEKGTTRRKGRDALRQLARITLAESGNTLPESKAQTRYSETDSLEVLLLKRIERDRDGTASTLTLLGGCQLRLPLKRYQLTKAEWRSLSATLMRQIVAVRPQDAPAALPLNVLEKFGLQHCFYLGNPAQDEAVFRVALVDETGHLQGVAQVPLYNGSAFEYRSDLGYQVIKD